MDAPGARLHVRVQGRGHEVVLLPSLGRGSEDFERLAADLVAAGLRVILPEPRGLGESQSVELPASLHDLARDVACVLEATCVRPATVVGHAFGNRVGRMLACDRPDLVRDLVLIAAGGIVPMDPSIQASLLACFDLAQPREEHLRHVARAFFADPAHATRWAAGWHPDVAYVQIAAGRATAVEEWWEAGQRPILVLQPARDAIAPAENARRLRAALGPERVQIVEIAGAGHAALPEQPDAIARAVVRFVRRASGGTPGATFD